MMNKEVEEWIFKLSLTQRVCNPKGRLVVFLISIIIEIYLMTLFILDAEIWYIYLTAFAAVIYFQVSMVKGEGHDPKASLDEIIVKIGERKFSYGVRGHELEIDIPMKLEPGLFGCYNLFFGPAHSFTIPKKLACDVFFLARMNEERLLL